MEKKDIKSLTLEELKAEMAAAGEKSFRAAQLYEWMHRKLSRSFKEMTNIPLAMKEKCGQQLSCKNFDLQSVLPARHAGAIVTVAQNLCKWPIHDWSNFGPMP